MSHSFKICVLTLCFAIYCANGVRILGIFHMNSYSHFIMADRIMKELAMRGHEVTVITPFEQKVSVKNLKHVVLKDYNKHQNAAKSNMLQRAEMSPITAGLRLLRFSNFFTEAVLNNTSVQDLLKSDSKFDLVIQEKFLNEAFVGFAHHYKAPLVMVTGIGASRWSCPQMGNPNNPSYMVDLFLAYPSRMTFAQRVWNSFVQVFSELLDHLWRYPVQNALLQKYFPGAPHVVDLLYNTSLMLVNSHVSINSAVPLVPNMIEIGGYHLEPLKGLPQDLKEYLDEAKEGAIFFSMGSNLKSADLPVQKRNDILKAFGGMKQKVLWKWEEDVLPGQPANVKLGKWLPQQDILAHPNVKLFITHGGLLSTIEAIHHGVPVLGIPIFGDQQLNVKNAEQEGYGLGIPYTELNAEILTSKLNELLTNPRYTENAKKRSKIMRDQETQPLDRAIFWIEHVIRHNGAPHLRTAALDLAWYQYLLLDVVAVVLVIVLISLWILSKIARLLFCRKRTNAVKKNKKTN